jgi:predicted negative regulator of RcsB-dependent stress response
MSDKIIKKNFLEKYTNFVKKNFKILIILIIAVLILLCSFFFYKNIQDRNNIKVAEEFTQASILVKQKKIKKSKLLLENIINKNHQFYSPLALYLLIDNNIETESTKIIIFFDKILKNNSIDEENLNLIKIKKAVYLINLDEENLIVETLNPIINSRSVWRKIAINLISDYFLSKNQKSKADEYMRLLSTEKNK